MTRLVLNNNGFVVNIAELGLCMTGFVLIIRRVSLTLTGFPQNFTGFDLNIT